MTPTDSSTYPSRLLHMAASDATQLALRDWPLALGVKPRAQVLLVHGLGEHSGRYAALARRRYDAGATRYFEVLDAERDLLATQQQVVQAEHALLTARLRLYAALGGGSRTLAPLPLPLQKSEE